jgi:hypothetical protein
MAMPTIAATSATLIFGDSVVDLEREIRSLSATTLALSIVVNNVFQRLAKDPTLREAIKAGFKRAADTAETVAIAVGKTASPEHSVGALLIIEEMRSVALGNEEGPRADPLA